MTSTLISTLLRWRAVSPHDIAIRSSEREYTVDELCEQVSQVVGVIEASRFTPEDLVAVSAEGVDEVVYLLSIHAVGGMSVITPSEQEFRDSGAGQLLHAGRSWAPTRSIDASKPVRKPSLSWLERENVDENAVVHVCLTSGTTGKPKLVEYTNHTIARRVEGYRLIWPVKDAATLFRLSSVAGFVGLCAALTEREPFVVINSVDTQTLAMLRSTAVHALCGAPNQIAQLVHAARSAGIALSFSTILTAGAPQTPQFVSAAKSVCSGVIANVYGSTEAGTAARSTEEAAAAFRGNPVLDTEFQVVDGDWRPVPRGIEGEIRYRNPGLCASYVVDGVRELIANDGWFYPGDTGLLEEDGTILITGRTSEIVNVAGVKVNPLDVEAAVESIPAVRDAGCTPVTLSDGLTHLVLAVVVPNRETYDEVVALLETRDPAGRPNIVVSVPTIPRNRNGKINRTSLAEKLGLAIRLTHRGVSG